VSPVPTTANTLTRPRSLGFGARIDDMYLRLAPANRSPLRLGHTALQAQRIDFSALPEELRSEFGAIFARGSLIGGEGLDRAHRIPREETDTTRYWTSEGILVPLPQRGDVAEVGLQYDLTSIYTANAARAPVAFNNSLYARYAGSTTVLLRVDSPTGGESFATEDPQSGEAAVAITGGPVVVGDYLYVALGANGIHRRTISPATWAHYSDLNASTGLWSVRNRLIAAAGNALYEVTASGAAPSAFYTIGGSGARWDMVADAGAAVLASASATNARFSTLYGFAPDASGALVVRSAQQQPDGEQIVAMVAAFGFIFYTTVADVTTTTSAKLWRAELDPTSLTLTNVQLMKAFPNSETLSGHRLVMRGTDLLAGRHTTKPGLWRYDAVNAGLHTDVLATATSSASITYPPTPLYAYGATFVFSNAGIHRVSTATYVTSGYLISPLADFYTADPKEWVGARLETATVTGGARVELYYSTNPDAITDAAHTSWTLVKQISSGTDTSETSLSSIESRYLAAKVILTAPTDAGDTPMLRSFSFRAYPGPSDVQIELPVSVADRVERPGRAATAIKGLGESVWTELLSKQGQGVELQLLDTDETYRGVVEEVALQETTRSPRGFQAPIAMVRFRGRRAGSGSVFAGAGAGGVDTLGITTLGGVS
jgi:hypothetical protein